MDKKILILGAGPTGLGAAWRLEKLGYRNWRLFEKENQPGGLSASVVDSSGFVWDYGGHIIFSSIDRFNSLVSELLGDEIVKHARESWVRIYDRFIKYPFQSNFHFLQEQVVLECVEGLLGIQDVEPDRTNFLTWVNTVFGKGIAEHFMIPYNEKVWAVDLKGMDAGWIAERVTTVDIRKVIENIIYRKEDSNWGPNREFSYPLNGGTGGLFTKMASVLDSNIEYGRAIEKIDIRKKELVLADRAKYNYDILISTIPLPELIKIIDRPPESLVKRGKNFLTNQGIMTGIGIKRPCPSNKNWTYFPQNKHPFYRVTYLSNYSPNNTPGDRYFSLLCEISTSERTSYNVGSILDETVEGLIDAAFLESDDRERIVSTWVADIPYSLPVPFMGRNRDIGRIHELLEKNQLFSRGRFGSWKYEIGNMDHSVMQGMELVERIFSIGEEVVFNSC